MTKIPNPAEVITVTLGGKKFRAGRRTAAHLEWTIERLAEKYPQARLVVIQACYNTGVEASAGTHDKDGVFDVEIVGLSWEDAQAFLRWHGWAAWWRHTGSWAPRSKWHIHMASLGCPGPVGYLIDGGISLFGRVVASSQIADYRAHRDGLAGHASDPTPHPANIDSKVFDYPAYVRFKALPTVSLARVVTAAKTPTWRLALAPKVLADRRRVLRALAAEKCETFRDWQVRQGVKRESASGIPGRPALEALGARHGFRVVS